MASYSDMQARIIDEMVDVSLTTARVQNAILDAVAKYQEERFYFNVLRTSPGFTTVAEQEFYAAADWAQDIYTAHIDSLTIIAFGSRYTLKPQTPQWFEENSMGLEWYSMPTDWTYVSESIRLYPVPDNAYPMIVTGTQIFPALLNPTDSNPWTNDGAELIRCCAEGILYRRVARDQANAAIAAQDEQQALLTLRGKSAQRGAPARVRVKSWF